MAGIGFELRRLLRRDSYLGLLQAYGYAGIISSGPWVLSILGILILGFMTLSKHEPSIFVSQFQISITYLISLSLILTGVIQHAFIRYISDLIFIKKIQAVLPSFHALLLLTTVVSGAIALVLVFVFFTEEDIGYHLLMTMSFVVLCNIWVSANILSGLKAYKTILFVFGFAYTVVVVVGYYLRIFGLNGLLFGFLVGHVVLFLGMFLSIYRHYSTDNFIDFDFIKPKSMYVSLIFSGFLYNLGVWIDKYIFWFYPTTAHNVIGPLRASVIYDLPIFLAYLFIIPGMAVFLLRMETDFVEYYDRFYTAIREGGTLAEIKSMHAGMVKSARTGIFDIIKIQTVAIVLTIVAGPWFLSILGISHLYRYLLSIDVVGASLQVVFLGLLNIFFYLDKRAHALWITLLFVVANGIFTLISIQLGPFYFGYGFAAALLVAIMLAFILLNSDFEQLEYHTFMGKT